uniref:PEP-CTERM protein-sorting domain-containing protein n=1 Tax=Solibacter usitatus (strain Ellin6076) TaxID=234267 RepID=Q01TI3_SOLUE
MKALLGLLLALSCVSSVHASTLEISTLDILDTLVVFPFNRRAVNGNHITLRGESGAGVIPEQRVDFVEPVTKEVSDVLFIRPISFEFVSDTEGGLSHTPPKYNQRVDAEEIDRNLRSPIRISVCSDRSSDDPLVGPFGCLGLANSDVVRVLGPGGVVIDAVTLDESGERGLGVVLDIPEQEIDFYAGGELSDYVLFHATTIRFISDRPEHSFVPGTTARTLVGERHFNLPLFSLRFESDTDVPEPSTRLLLATVSVGLLFCRKFLHLRPARIR